MTDKLGEPHSADGAGGGVAEKLTVSLTPDPSLAQSTLAGTHWGFTLGSKAGVPCGSLQSKIEAVCSSG